jgi:predicted kinase
MRNLILLIGPPCSGKSTWAKKYVLENTRTLRFNRDDLRYMLRGLPILESLDEQVVTKMIMIGIREGIVNGRDVIIDQTNCKFKYISQFVKLAEELEAQPKLKVFREELNELKKRNIIRSIDTHISPIPEDVIERMYNWQEQLLQLPDFKRLLENEQYMV